MNERRHYFDYCPRPWQAQVLEALEGRRLAVVVAHRRAGKTEAMCLRLLLAAIYARSGHPSALFAYVAPFLNQAKAVAWERLKYYCRALPRLKISESELSLTLWNGAAVRLFGADYPDRLRGLGFDGVVMDEVAQMRPETWPDVVRPALSDRRGWAVFIGTPKGLNLFHEIYQTALKEPDKWYAGLFAAQDTGVIEAEELEQLRSEMGENSFRREFLCDFNSDTDSNFIDFTQVQEAWRRPAPTVNLAPLVLGLDVARYGDDRTALLARRGSAVEKVYVWQGRDLMYTADHCSLIINELRPQAVFVDAVGLGAGVADRLRQLGHRVMEVNSGAPAHDSARFANLKAEMWFRLRQWLGEGASLGGSDQLRSDLLAPGYDFDANGRLKIESKKQLKGRGLRSTDLADALALTFARPVAAVEIKRARPAAAEMD